METVVYPKFNTETGVILISQATSDAIDIRTAANLAIVMPTAWTAAGLSFLGSDSIDGTFQSIYNDAGTEITATATASQNVSMNTAVMNITQFAYIKIRSGTAGTPVVQAAERSIKVVYKS